VKQLFASLMVALALSITVVFVANAQQSGIAGGYSEKPVTDSVVVSAANFAVTEVSRLEVRPISLIAITRAESQVVAGMNYRLRLSVRDSGEIREINAVVYHNLTNQYPLTSWNRTGDDNKREVKVFLVRLGDSGKTGIKFGCDDGLVPVMRAINPKGDPLKAAIQELLAIPQDYQHGLRNYWVGRNLKLRSVRLHKGTATIKISGEVFVAGICDEPRIEEQIKATALQFLPVKRIKVLMNDLPLSAANR
jgi:hypothetical protein